MNRSLITVAIVVITMLAVMITRAQDANPKPKPKKYECVADGQETKLPNPRNCSEGLFCKGDSTLAEHIPCDEGYLYNITTKVKEKHILK